jgi:hypothetical protein
MFSALPPINLISYHILFYYKQLHDEFAYDKSEGEQ